MRRNDSFRSDYSGRSDRSYSSYGGGDRGGGGGDRRYGGDRDRGGYGGGDRDRGGYGTPYGRGGGGRGGRGGGGGGRGGGGDHTFDQRPIMGPVQTQLPERIEILTPKSIQVNSTALNLVRAKPVFQYELKLKGFKCKEENEEGVDIFKVPNSDGARNMKYRAFNEIFHLMLTQNTAIFQSDQKDENGDHKHLYVFDRSCLFFCDLDVCGDVTERLFEIETRDIPYEHRSFVCNFKKVQIRLVKAGKIEPAAAVGQPDSVQRPILQYLDILFDQFAYKNDRYFVFPSKFFFKDSNKEILNRNYVLKSGLQKNIRSTASGIVLQVDAKKSTFYAARPLLAFLDTERVPPRDLESPQCRRDILKLIKGLYVRTNHLDFNRVFPVAALSELPADQIIFDYEGGKISVAEYFRRRYNKPLHYPRYLCVEKRGAFYPLEFLDIIDGQRISRERMSPELNQQMIRACQAKPVDLLRDLDDQMPDAGFLNSNSFLKIAGIRIVNPRLEIRGQELPKPAIVYSNGIMKLKSGGWRQDGAMYLQSATIDKLAIIIGGRPQCDERRWIGDLISMAEQKGLRIRHHEPMNLRSSPNDQEGVVNFARDLVSQGFDYLMWLCDSKELHQAIKFSEIGTKVCTQQVKLDSMKKGRDTMGNIIHKMNLKAGGRNYAVSTNPEIANRMRCDLIKSALDTTCVIGIEMSHPAAMGRADRMLNAENPEPTTVGIAHTTDATGCVANGDYFYIPRGTTVIDHPKLPEFVQNALREFHLKSGKYATRLLIYRSGISEGAFADVAQKECANIMRAVQGMNPQPAVTMVVVQRKSNHRLFQARDIMSNMNSGAPAPVQNVTPGTSITTGVTNPRFKEFIMIAHRALLGTAKPIVGTVIFESIKNSFTIDQLEHLSNALCYQHEIVTAPIALPGPLRSASDLALRGLNNWKFASNSGSLAGGDREYQREYTKDEEIAMAQRALDRHNERLAASITNKKFWA